MKELSIEEKAKAYDKALQKAKYLHEAAANGRYDIEVKTFECIFPELKENEDERMCNIAIYACKYMVDNFENSTKQYEDAIAWLEKQGEQKSKKVSIWKHWKDGIAGNGEGEPIYLIKAGNTYNLSSCLGFECDYIELSELEKMLSEKQGEQKPIIDGILTATNYDKMFQNCNVHKFKVGDWITIDNPCQIISVNNENYIVQYCDDEKTHMLSKRFCDSYFHLWTIQDAKDGDVLVYNNGTVEIILLFKKWMDGVGKGAYSYAHTFDNKILFNDWSDCGYATHPATKEQHELLFQKMREEGYVWDAEKKEVRNIEKQGEQKELLNGEDYGIDGLYHAIEILERTIGLVEGYQSDDGILEHQIAIDTLKSIYNKSKWTEEDVIRLDRICKKLWKNRKGDTDEIYQQEQDVNWLKSLKERYTWKPSDEQIKAIRLARSFVVDDFGEHPTLSEILMELEEQLQKIKENKQ